MGKNCPAIYDVFFNYTKAFVGSIFILKVSYYSDDLAIYYFKKKKEKLFMKLK